MLQVAEGGQTHIHLQQIAQGRCQFQVVFNGNLFPGEIQGTLPFRRNDNDTQGMLRGRTHGTPAGTSDIYTCLHYREQRHLTDCDNTFYRYLLLLQRDAAIDLIARRNTGETAKLSRGPAISTGYTRIVPCIVNSSKGSEKQGSNLTLSGRNELR